MFEQLFNSPFLYSLSLTLVHFLWQGLLVALILKSLLFIVDTNKSKLRYTLATLAMLANAILAMLTFTMVYPDAGSGINSNLSPIPLTSLVNELTQQNALLTYQELLPSILAYSLPYLSLLWLATIAILASKLLIEIYNVNNLPLHSSIQPSAALSARFDELAKQIKLPKTPQLLISLKAEVPMAIGWLKPVVLLPATMVTGLNTAQLEMLILHELAHIRRHDYLVNFLQTLIELLFFFHPSVHWIGKQMRNEREYCSDDIAVEHCGDAIAYAHTLTDTASLCTKNHFHTIPTMAMAASGGDLKARVLRLVDHHCAPANNTSKWLAAMSLLLALALLSINQLLTMPFAQQLNNQFPWQSNTAMSRNILNADVSSIEFENNTDKQVTPPKKDSIAQQLLGHQTTAPNNSLIKVEKKQNSSTLLLQDNIEITAAIVEPIAISPLETSLNIAEDTNLRSLISNKGQTVEADFKEVQTSQLASTLTKRSETTQITPENTDIVHVDKNLPSIDKRQSLSFEKPKSHVTLPVISTDQLNPQTAVSNVPQKKNQQVALAYNKGLSIKEDPYRQLSYSQEVNKLASQNELYQASHTFKTERDLSLKAIKIEKTTPKAMNIPSSFSAKLLNSTSPIYPSLAKRRGIEMEVKVDFTIGRNGKVKAINFAQQSKLVYFKSAIRSAIRKWRFSPAIKDNRKVESKMSKIFSFSLQT
jgi:TonB family protein